MPAVLAATWVLGPFPQPGPQPARATQSPVRLGGGGGGLFLFFGVTGDASASALRKQPSSLYLKHKTTRTKPYWWSSICFFRPSRSCQLRIRSLDWTPNCVFRASWAQHEAARITPAWLPRYPVPRGLRRPEAEAAAATSHKAMSNAVVVASTVGRCGREHGRGRATCPTGTPCRCTQDARQGIIPESYGISPSN
jgi:hypothetical protein